MAPCPTRSRNHTFAHLATAIDDAFTRWDRAHLHCFDLADMLLTGPCRWGEPPHGSQPSHRARLSRLKPGQQFVYTFDLGDDWTHLCTVAAARVDPLETLGVLPDTPCRTGAGV